MTEVSLLHTSSELRHQVVFLVKKNYLIFVFSLVCRCASRPWQQSELLRCDKRRHGCSHWFLGQFPPNLELKQTSSLFCSITACQLPFLLLTSYIMTHRLGWTTIVSRNTPNSSRPADLWQSTNSFYLFLSGDFFTQLLQRNNNKSP